MSSKAIGERSVTTPAIVTLDKSRHDINVQCKHGCYRGSGVISSNLEGMTAGNLLVGGVVGLGVDAATGAMNKYAQYTQISMVPDPGCINPAPPQPVQQ
ncbi:MAG: hypothetical protein LCH46_06040 [Proteobacteria bacterium]|nr:hypothetical protein [Pseudomonadota bacterium]